MPSLLEALDKKYGTSDDDSDFDGEDVISIYIPKVPPLQRIPELLILNDCDIDCAGNEECLKNKCAAVKELDLAQNKLSKWDEVFSILQHMPKVEFVNLSKNHLNGPILNPSNSCLKSLRSLVLNNTKIDWDNVHKLINSLPVLEELHLSLNDYQSVLIDTLETAALVDSERNDSDRKKTKAHVGVKKIHFTGNPVENWAEICRLGRVFPQLESLVLAECHLSCIDSPRKFDEVKKETDAATSSAAANGNEQESAHEFFKNLRFLNVSNTRINTWEDVDRLAEFPNLKSLRVQGWPLWNRCDSTEHERRQLLIARLPHIVTLNGGGPITVQEREDSERSFIRYYMDRPESDRPPRYNKLLQTHGKLDPLVNIDLRPEKRVKIKITLDDHSEILTIDVYRTVLELKQRLESIVGFPPNKMRLFYIDQDLREQQGPEEMKYPNKQLYSYNMASGDEILVDRKN